MPVSCYVNRVGCNQIHINYRDLSNKYTLTTGEMRCRSVAMWTGLAMIICRSKTCTQSTPLKKNCGFYPVRTNLHPSQYIFHILVLAAPIRRGKMPSGLHQETRKAKETQRCIPQHTIALSKSPKALRNQSESGSAQQSVVCLLATGDWF